MADVKVPELSEMMSNLFGGQSNGGGGGGATANGQAAIQAGGQGARIKGNRRK